MMPFVPWPTPDDTPALLQALAAGERQALETLYRRLAPAVYRYALGLSGDASLAADATHDAFAALAERPRAFDPALGTLGGWLAGVARHTLLARQRRRGREVDIDDDTLDAMPDDAASPERCLVRRQDLSQLWAALHSLPWALREAVVLVDLQERPYAEAARIAGCELNTLRTRLHRGRARLAEHPALRVAPEPAPSPAASAPRGEQA